MDDWVLLLIIFLAWVVFAPIIALVKASRSADAHRRVLLLEDKIRALEDKLNAQAGHKPASAYAVQDADLKSEAEYTEEEKETPAADRFIPEAYEVTDSASVAEFEPDLSPNEAEIMPQPALGNDLLNRPAFLLAPESDAVLRAPSGNEDLAAPDTDTDEERTADETPTPAAPHMEPQSASPAIVSAPISDPVGGAVNLGRNLLRHRNMWVLGGVVLLLCGMIFLAKLAVEMGWYNPSLRLASGGLLGVALLGFGWRSRESKPQLGQIMQGGGVAAFYLVVVAAVKLHDMIPPIAGLAVLLGLVLLSSILAIIQNSAWMAHVSMVSGFLAPLIMSDGSGNFVALFSIFIILNIGMLLIFRFRNWGHLCLTTFILTYGIGGIWGLDAYTPELWTRVEPFLLAFTAIYVLVILRLSSRISLISKETEAAPAHEGQRESIFSPPRLHRFFVLAVPTIFLLYQLEVVGHLPMAMAFSGLGLGFICLAGAARLWKRQGQARLLDSQIYFVLAVAGLNLTLLFSGLDTGFARMTMLFYLGVTWVVEGALFIHIPRSNSDASLAGAKFMRRLGVVLLLIGTSLAGILALQMFGDTVRIASGEGAAVNFHLLAGAIIISVFSLLAAWGNRPASENGAAGQGMLWELKSFSGGYIYSMTFALAAIWLLGGTFAAFAEFEHGLTYSSLTLAGLLCVALFTRARLEWNALRLLLVLPLFFAVPKLLAAGYAVLIILFAQNIVSHPELALSFTEFLHAVTPPALFFLLLGVEDHVLAPRSRDSEAHASLRLSLPGLVYALLVACLPTLLYSLLAPETLDLLAGSWFRAILLALSLATLWLLIKFAPAYARENASAESKIRLTLWTVSALLPIGQMLIWQYNTLFAPAWMDPLPYIPLLNLFDLGAAMVCFTLWFWWRKNIEVHKQHLPSAVNSFTGEALICVMAFVAGHGVILRALAIFFYGTVYTDDIFSEQLSQICLTLYWGLCGFALMFSSSKLRLRRLWVCGATLLLVAAAKAVLFDTSSAITLARVGVYFGIGVLFICTGYFIPMPGSERDRKLNPEPSSTPKEA